MYVLYSVLSVDMPTAVKKRQLRKMASVRDGMVTAHVPWSVYARKCKSQTHKDRLCIWRKYLRLSLEVGEVCLIFT